MDIIIMRRYDAIKIICNNFKNSKFISTLGLTSKELYTFNDNKSNFYMLGSMGLASSFGFGVAFNNNSIHVIVLDGDGSILMNLGSLTTIGTYNLNNYLLVIFDNGAYGTTGNQKTNTSKGTNLYTIALGSNCFPVYQFDNLNKLKENIKYIQFGVLILKINLINENTKNILMSPYYIKDRFKKGILNIKII